ncbi:hypothetical protein GGF32_000608 [Allomyces javanicus]|nr:hypothetical protein GGF32_000608 [Allomyces javanicus]
MAKLSSPLASVPVPVVRALNLLVLIAVFVINGLAGSTTLIGGYNTGQLSDLLPNYFVPAGFAFGIWGLIYLFFGIFGVYQILPRSYDSAAINSCVGLVWIGNGLLNIAWILVWGYRILPITVIIIIAMWGTTMIIYARLKSKYPDPTWTDAICVHTCFALYTAWLTGASWLNVYAVTTTRDPSYVAWTIGGLVVLGVMEIAIATWAKDPIFTAVGTWTLAANYVKNKDVDMLAPAVLGLCIILGIVTGALAVYRVVRWRRRAEFGAL